MRCWANSRFAGQPTKKGKSTSPIVPTPYFIPLQINVLKDVKITVPVHETRKDLVIVVEKSKRVIRVK